MQESQSDRSVNVRFKGTKMKGKLILVALVFTAVGTWGCQRKSFDPGLAGTFFPLSPGISWTYRIIDKGRSPTHILTERVIGGTRLGANAKAIEVESEYNGPTGILNSSIVYFPENGYFTRQSRGGESSKIVSAEKAFLPELLKPNLTWSNSLVPFELEPDIFHVTQDHRSFFDTSTIAVPAGDFSGCIRIETRALYQSASKSNPPLELKYVDWYAPHIGLVKTIVWQTGFFGSELARIELLKFGYSEPKTKALNVATSNISLSGSSSPLMAR
jgi:hypothetical protein